MENQKYYLKKIKNMISIILPTYNEVDNILPLIEQITFHMKGLDFEIIVVDDNSPDGTSDVVREAMKRFSHLRLLVRTSERGLVPSIRDGIKKSVGNICIWMDADLSMSPALIKQFVHQINFGADLVIGSRYIPGGGMKGVRLNGEKTPLFEVWKNLNMSEDSFVGAMVSKLGNLIFRFVLDSSIHDYSSGFFGGMKSVLTTLPLEGHIVDYCISLPYCAIMRGLKVVEVPMILNTRKNGESKTTNGFFSVLYVASQCLYKAIVLRIKIKDERKQN